MTWEFICFIPGHGMGVIRVEADSEEEAEAIARDKFLTTMARFRICQMMDRVVAGIKKFPDDPRVN